MKIKLAAALSAALLASAASAEQATIDSSKLRLGGSISQNVVDSPFGGGSYDAMGFSVFAGYELPNDMNQVTTSVEVGYSKTDDFFSGTNSDISGLWIAGVAEKDLPEISPKLFALARFGLDLGDDDGLLMGAGAGLHLSSKLDARAEYINKDASSVYQASVIFKF